MIDSCIDVLDNRFIYNFQTSVNFDRVILFGAGGRGVSAQKFLQDLGVKVLFFVDNGADKWGTQFHALPVHPPEKVMETPGVSVVVASHAYHAITRQLQKMGVNNVYYNFRSVSSNYRHDLIEINLTDIETVFKHLADDESRKCYASVIKMFREGDEGYLRRCNYSIYRHPKVLPAPGDVIADIGAFDGDTAFEFDHICNGDCTIYCFKPSPDNYHALQKNIYKKGVEKRFIPVKLGLWDVMEEMAFSPNYDSPTASRVGVGSEAIMVIDLDRFVRQEQTRINFIKMDIEGAEPNAVRCAPETIKRDRPSLQICLYHSPEHLWEIPLFIKSLVPEYTFYTGHHSLNRSDTVLYATCRN